MKVTLVASWFGPWPGWIKRFFQQVTDNHPPISVLIYHDDETRAGFPGVSLRRTTFDAFKTLLSERLGLRVAKASPYGLCDVRPAYGEALAEELAGSDWWGWFDFDCAWGDWRSYLTAERLDALDILSSETYCVNGPWTILRNTREIVELHRQTSRDALISPQHCCYDEFGFTSLVKDSSLRVGYEPIGSHSQHSPFRGCVKRDGKLYETDERGKELREIMLYHFPGHKERWPLQGVR